MLKASKSVWLSLLVILFTVVPAKANKILELDRSNNTVKLEIDGKVVTAKLQDFNLTEIPEAADTFVRPLNVQNAFIDTKRKNELRVEFDWFHDAQQLPGFEFIRDNYTLPRINYKRSFAAKIPFRLGVGTSLNLASFDFEASSGVFSEFSELGLGSIVLNFDTSIINKRDFVLNLFFDQFLPTQSIGGTLLARDGFGDNYGFQTGIRYQLAFLKYLRLFGDLAYGKYMDFGDNSNFSFDSLIYYNELIVDIMRRINLSFGLLGQSLYNDTDFNQLYFVPGAIVSFGKNRNFQARLGFPIGLTEDADDFGIQASLFTLF